MDPNACFFAFCGAVGDGDLYCAADAAECYAEWIAKGGFPAEYGYSFVAKLDPEQDRFGTASTQDLAKRGTVESWHDCFESAGSDVR